jgi:hypothetical protein
VVGRNDKLREGEHRARFIVPSLIGVNAVKIEQKDEWHCEKTIAFKGPHS